ncbi:MAG: hypothetical protein ACTSRG_03880 [Candidatus Helarchaeota archaeon]
MKIAQFPSLPWEDLLNPQQPTTPGLSTADYSNFYYIVIIIGIAALILIIVYGLIGEDKEERVGYE